MSYVTGVVVAVGVLDQSVMPVVNQWLSQHNYRSGLFQLDQLCGGNKHPQFHLGGGGFNYFPEEEFLEFLGTLRLHQPENCVVLMQPEDGQTRVWRADSLTGILS